MSPCPRTFLREPRSSSASVRSTARTGRRNRLSARCSGARYNSRMSREGPRARIHGTTVLCVRRDNKAVMAGDGQVTMGQQVMKHTARKIRSLFNDKVLAGFSGATGDALSAFERLGGQVEEH